MTKQTINIGSAANDGTGDPLRTAFDKINANFTEVYNELGGSSGSSLAFSGNAIISDVTNENINLTPNGTGSVVINSNLEVKGTTTQINATSLQIEDNLLELNRNSSGTDVDAGIYVQRGGAGNNAVFYWNEGDDKFKAVLSTSTGAATAVLDTSTATIVANIEGNVTSTGTSTFDVLSINQINVNDSTTISVSSGMQVDGTLSANRLDTSFIENSDSSAITVNTDMRIDGNLTASDGMDTDVVRVNTLSSYDSTAIDVNGGLRVSGALAVNTVTADDSTSIEITPPTIFKENVTIQGWLIVTDSLTFGVNDAASSSVVVLDINKQVHYLASGNQDYQLNIPAGGDGLSMTFIVGNPTDAGFDSANNPLEETKITVQKVRDHQGEIIENYEWYPFIVPGVTGTDTSSARRTMAQAIFYSGAWHLDFYIPA